MSIQRVSLFIFLSMLIHMSMLGLGGFYQPPSPSFTSGSMPIQLTQEAQNVARALKPMPPIPSAQTKNKFTSRPLKTKRYIKNKKSHKSDASLNEKIKGNLLPPKYPFLSRLKREEGTVELLLTFSNTGRVVSVKIKKSSGYPRLDRAALKSFAPKNTALFKNSRYTTTQIKKIVFKFSK